MQQQTDSLTKIPEDKKFQPAPQVKILRHDLLTKT